MTILQTQEPKHKMPVEQGHNSHSQEVLWDENYFNTKKPRNFSGRNDSNHSMYYGNESHNNNNNGKPILDMSQVPRPRRDYSLPRFRDDENSNGEEINARYNSRHHSIPNSSKEVNGYTNYQDMNFEELGYIDVPVHWDNQDNNDSRLTKSLQFSSTGNGLNRLYNHPTEMKRPSNAELQEFKTENIVPDGYATISRRGGRKGSIDNSALFRKTSDSNLRQLNLQSNGLSEPKFLAHSLALSSSSSKTAEEQSRPNMLNLSHTIHALPQHEIQVKQARMVYLKESEPLFSTQPVGGQSSGPGTPVSEDFSYTPSESSTPDLDSRKHYGSNSQSLNSSLNSSTDLDSKKSNTGKSPLQTITESFSGILKVKQKREEEGKPRLLRSNSTPNVLEAVEDEDIDQDDYGFLNYHSFRSKKHPFKTSSASALQKAKTSTRASDMDGLLGQGQTRSISKKWRKPKGVQNKSTPSTWKPQGHCTWSNAGGKRLVLTPSQMLHLTEQERLVLQKIALSKLQNMGLGCSVVIPKESRTKRSKSRVFTLKKRSSSGGLLDNLKDKNKDNKLSDSVTKGWVFGHSLSKVVSNDKELGRGCPCPLSERKDSVDLTKPLRKSSNSSGCAVSTESLSESDSRSTGSTLLDALSLSSMGKGESSENEPSLQPHTPRVPYIVHTCFKHIESQGLNTVGIFRIASVKKRVKQLKDEFDCGNEVELSGEWSPHDVGALLKEFFRDLPDPLLTRDLYSPFLSTCKFKDSSQKRHLALSLLISLLPTANRDTLFALLRFLNVVAQHSADTVNQYGEEVPGNKMDSTNLATLFGPNILHKSKGGEFQVESAERAEQRCDVISVVKDLLDNYVQLFEIAPDLQDEVFRAMLESNPEVLDVLLKRKCQLQGLEMEAESSSMYEENDGLSCSQTSENLSSSMRLTQQEQQIAAVHNQESRSQQQQPRTFNETLKLQQRHQVQASQMHKSQSAVIHRRERISSTKETVSPNKQHVSLKQMFRLSTPESILTSKRESPNVSPSPKAMKPTIASNVKVTGPSDSPVVDRTKLFSSAKAFLSPRTSRKKEEEVQKRSGGRLLAVPHPFLRTGSSRDIISSHNKDASTSSLSSGYFGGSSRSGTTSPVTPETPPPHQQHHHHHSHSQQHYHASHPEHYSGSNNSSNSNKWYSPQDTPPPTPPTRAQVFDFSKTIESGSSFQRTSSLSRPLGITRSTSSPSPVLPNWQAERWKHWEEEAKQRSTETQEQETLV